MDEDQLSRLSLRLPRDLHEELGRLAQQGGRSVNADVIERLVASIDTEKRKSGQGAVEPFTGLLPAPLLARIDNYSRENGYQTRAVAVHKLISDALQARETVDDILRQLVVAYSKTKDLRAISQLVLSIHSQVNTIRVNEHELSFTMQNQDSGAITRSGTLKKGIDNGEYMRLDDYKLDPASSTRKSGSGGWEPSGSDLDDEIPF